VWDATVGWEVNEHKLVDRFHPGLVDALAARGVGTSRFVWFFRQPRDEDRRASWRKPFLEGDAIALQGFLKAWDIAGAILSFRAWAIYARWSRGIEFQRAFREHGLDLYPLFRIPLLYHFLGTVIPLCRLIALATARACTVVRPALTLSYLEHFSLGRAHFEGVRRAGVTVSTTMQHSSVSTGTTFYSLDPDLEFQGEPDGCAVPHPAHVFVMGGLAVDLFKKWGYAPHQVHLTGSTRYRHVHELRQSVRRMRAVRHSNATRTIGVLLTPGLSDNLEMDWIEAVHVAVQNLPGVQLSLRKHPGSSLDLHPRFQRLRDLIRPTTESLAEDLAWADLVVFSYSTVADEAFVCGLPTWQWPPIGYKSCALSEIVAIPQFHTVAAFREALTSFTHDRRPWIPSERDVSVATARLFGPADGCEAERIAAQIVRIHADRERCRQVSLR
jgi:hypothetical protein